MEQGHYSGHPELVGKAEPDVEHHQPQRQQHGRTGFIAELIAHLRANKLDLQQFQITVARLEHVKHDIANLVRIDTVLGGHPNIHFLGRTIMLNHRITKAGFGQIRPGLGQLHIHRAFHHDGGAASEIQAQVQTPGHQQNYGDDHQRNGQHAQGFPGSHEIDVLFFLTHRHHRLRYSVWPVHGHRDRRSFPPWHGCQ